MFCISSWGQVVTEQTVARDILLVLTEFAPVTIMMPDDVQTTNH